MGHGAYQLLWGCQERPLVSAAHLHWGLFLHVPLSISSGPFLFLFTSLVRLGHWGLKKGSGPKPRGNSTPQISQARGEDRFFQASSGDGGTGKERRSHMESKSPPLLPPPSTAHSQPEPGALKIVPEAQSPAALVTFWVAQAESRRAAGRPAAGPTGLIS